MPMHHCQKCLENNWEFKTKRDVNEKRGTYLKWAEATCKICGNEIEFGHKELGLIDRYGKRRFSTKAEYEIRDGEHYLKIDGKFVKVGLFKIDKKGKKDINGKYMQVLPI